MVSMPHLTQLRNWSVIIFDLISALCTNPKQPLQRKDFFARHSCKVKTMLYITKFYRLLCRIDSTISKPPDGTSTSCDCIYLPCLLFALSLSLLYTTSCPSLLNPYLDK